MKTYVLTVAYEGSEYCGWQIQPNGRSIQQVLQETLQQILRHPVQVVGSGRTDAGVHALGQVAHFRWVDELDCSMLRYALNRLLPKDIRISALTEADSTFHTRYTAKRKIYHYSITRGPVQSPFLRRTALHLSHPAFNVESLRKAALYLVGQQDFSAFANSPQEGSVAKNGVRTLYRLDVVQEADLVRLEFEGNGFLYKMVRNLVGTLIEVAIGKRAPEAMIEILASRDRRKAGRAALPHGLCLVEVIYSP